jgi:hypothetical protein
LQKGTPNTICTLRVNSSQTEQTSATHHAQKDRLCLILEKVSGANEI